MEVSFGELLAVLFALMIVQVIGTHLQVKAYRNAIHRLHARGNLGIGSCRRLLGPGSIVIIACDRNGMITGGEILQGMTVFSKFRVMQGIEGKHIHALKESYSHLPKKRRSYYKGHLQALEALELRFNHKEKEVKPTVFVVEESAGRTA